MKFPLLTGFRRSESTAPGPSGGGWPFFGPFLRPRSDGPRIRALGPKSMLAGIASVVDEFYPEVCPGTPPHIACPAPPQKAILPVGFRTRRTF